MNGYIQFLMPRLQTGSKTVFSGISYLQHLKLDSSNSVLNPFAQLRVPTLPNRVVVFPCLDEGGRRVEISLGEDSVNSNSEEVTVCKDNGLISVQYRGF
jgi:hypothetical protein